MSGQQSPSQGAKNPEKPDVYMTDIHSSAGGQYDHTPAGTSEQGSLPPPPGSAMSFSGRPRARPRRRPSPPGQASTPSLGLSRPQPPPAGPPGVTHVVPGQRVDPPGAVPSPAGSVPTTTGGNAPAFPLQMETVPGPVTGSRGQKRPYNALTDEEKHRGDAKGARNPKLVYQNWARVQMDQNHNLVLTSKKNHVLRNSYMIQTKNENGTGNELWFGTFTHAHGGVEMMQNFATHHPGATPIAVSIQVHTNRTAAENAALSQHVLPLLPYAHNSAFFHNGGLRQKRREEIACGNCGKLGHLLVNCVGPYSAEGDIAGCPVCNTKEHAVDECPHWPDLSNDSKVQTLVAQRANKCQIRPALNLCRFAVDHDREKGGQHSRSNMGLPWTRETAIVCATNEGNIQHMLHFNYETQKNGVYPDPNMNWPNLYAGRIPSTSWSDHKTRKWAARSTNPSDVDPTTVPLPSSPRADPSLAVVSRERVDLNTDAALDRFNTMLQKAPEELPPRSFN